MVSPDWKRLEHLRAGFLDGTAGERDYWQSESDLESYDATFAQRIGWKWRYVLEELLHRGWNIPVGSLMDYGCGSGIAGRTVLEAVGTDRCTTLLLHDRSAMAMHVAARKAQEQFPLLSVQQMPCLSFSGGTILISHVITELRPQQIKEVCAVIEQADAVVWVEPGTHAAATALIEAREMLRNTFHIVAPCTHSNECGMKAPVNYRHWCHFFAPPPPEAFTQREWAQFAENTGIDVSDLPLSYLVLDKRPVPEYAPHTVRLIARAHTTKSDAVVLACGEAGVQEYLVSKKKLPEFYRSLKKNEEQPCMQLQLRGREVIGIDKG